MKKIKFMTIGAVLAALATGALTSCNGGKGSVDVNALAKQIIITNDGNKISDDFKLPSYVSDGKDNYKLTWTSSNTSLLTFEYSVDDPATADYDESLDDVKAKITRPEDKLTPVEFYATVTVGDKSAKSETFSVRINKAISPEEEFKGYYDNAASKPTATVSGYVLAKSATSIYNNKTQCCIYLASDTYPDGAWFAYNVYIEDADYAKLTVGSYVTVDGNTVQPYNGVIEACYGTVAVDTTKSLTAEQVEAKRKNITAAVMDANQTLEKSLFYTQSNLVELNGAKIKTVSKEQNTTAGKYLSTEQTVFTVEVYGKEMNVILQQGMTKFEDAATKTLFDALVAKAKLGDYVSIKGILYGYQSIIITSVDDLTVETAKPAWATVDEAVEKVEIAEIYNDNAEVTLPAADGDVQITWAFEGNPTAASISSGKLVVVPTATAEKVVLVGTYKLGNFETVVKYEFNTLALTATQKATRASEEVATLLAKEYTNSNKIALEANAKYSGTTLSYEVTEGSSIAAIVNGALYLNGTAGTVKVKVTATCDGETAFKEATLTVVAKENTLAEVKKALSGSSEGSEVTVKCVIVGKFIGSNAAKRVYLQSMDGTYGMYIYSTAALDNLGALKNGDVVYVTGKGKDYNGQPEFTKDITVNPVYDLTGNVVTETIKSTTIAEATEANLKKQYNNNVKVTGSVTAWEDSQYGGGVATLADEKGNTFYVELNNYYLDLKAEPYTTMAAKLKVVGTDVTITGNVIYNSTKKTVVVAPTTSDTIADATIVKLTDAQAIEKVKEELAKLSKSIEADLALPATVKVANYTKTVAITYKVGDTAVTSVAYDNPTTATEVTVVATITCGSAAAETYNIVVTKDVLPNYTLKYNGSSNKNATEVNLNEALGLDATAITIVYEKGDPSSNTALRTDGIRMYGTNGKANGNKFTFTLNTAGKIFGKIKIAFDEGYSSTAKIIVNGEVVTANADGTYTINSSSFSIVNDNSGVTGTSNVQVRFQNIKFYTVDAQ